MSSSTAPVIDLSGLQTELRNANSANIDKVSTLELCQILNREDASVAAAVEPCLGIISKAIDAVAPRVRSGGRLFYIGAGTSGRLGVLDASEIPPTYSAPPDQFVAIIAGGEVALRHAREGAEDDAAAAATELSALGLGLDPARPDSLIGLASSGRTPYVLGGLAHARSLGCVVTIGIACVEPSAMAAEGNADFLVAAVTGPELVTGSTRMKAGTAQKMVLNMISTGVMIRTGKTYGNLMVDMKATNLKLKQRAKNLLRSIGGSKCPASDQELEALLDECKGSVKLVAATILLQRPVEEARERLERNEGILARVIDEINVPDTAATQRAGTQDKSELVLCVDGGGSKTTAVLLGINGESGVGHAGPSNLSNFGLDTALSNLSSAIKAGVDACPSTSGRPFRELSLAKVWVALAGHERPSIKCQVRPHLISALGVDPGTRLHIGSDIDFLPLAADLPAEVQSAIVLVAGTGSIAMSYRREGDSFVRTGRAGGWGHLLGDDGSGYGLGRDGLRVALEASDRLRLRGQAGEKKELAAPAPLDELAARIFDHFEAACPGLDRGDLLSTVLVPDLARHQSADAEAETARRIAEVSKIVVAASGTSETAKRIVQRGAESIGQLVITLLDELDISASGAALVLAGGLMQDEIYQEAVFSYLASRGIRFGTTRTVQDPALAGARFLLGQVRRSSNGVH